MNKELICGIIIGLLLGSVVLAPVAAYRPDSLADTASIMTIAAVSNPPAACAPAAPLSDFALIDERNLFEPAIKPYVAKPTPPPSSLPNFAEVTEPVWTSPAQGWTYAGYAVLEDVPMAILQQPDTGEGVILKEGETFRGGTVEKITPSQVSISFGEHTESLPKSDQYNVVPLSEPEAAPGAAATTAPTGPSRILPANRQPRAPRTQPRLSRPSSTLPSTPQIQEEAARLRAEWLARRARLMEEFRNRPAQP